MKTTPKALKDLFVALGGDPSAVDGLLTVDVLNAIATKYQGEGDATRIPDAIDAITAVADNIGGGGGGGGEVIMPRFVYLIIKNRVMAAFTTNANLRVAQEGTEMGVYNSDSQITAASAPQIAFNFTASVPIYGNYPTVDYVVGIKPVLSSTEFQVIASEGTEAILIGSDSDGTKYYRVKFSADYGLITISNPA